MASPWVVVPEKVTYIRDVGMSLGGKSQKFVVCVWDDWLVPG